MSIIYFGGAKGGTGKSICASLLIYYYQLNNISPVVIDTDFDVPDVYKAHKDLCETYVYEIHDIDGWEDFIKTLTSAIEKDPQRPIIINSAGNNQYAFREYGGVFDGIVDEYHVDFINFWVASTDIHSLVLLQDFINLIKHQRVCLIKNGFYGKEQRFSLLDGTTKLEKGGLTTVYLPKAAGTYLSKFNVEHTPMIKLKETLPTFERMFADAWLTKACKTIEQALSIAQPITLEEGE